MLTTLRVKNLALVETARVEFAPGLNVITGETGAGKSILIGALGLVLGERADRTLVRAGEDACGAEASFQLADPEPVNRTLAAHDLPPCEDGLLILRRIVKVSGTSQATINDSPTTLGVLQEIGDLLVDMHGPHDHQSLLHPEAQVDLLDAFGHLQSDRAAYEKAHGLVRELETRRDALKAEGDVEGQLDLLSYRVKEIEEAAPVEGEEEKVEQEQRLLGNAQRVLELGGGVMQSLLEGEGSAFDSLAAAQKALAELERIAPPAAAWKEEAAAAASRVQALAADLGRFLEGIEADSGRLQWLDERLAIYQRLRRKYGGSVPEILNVLETSRARLNLLKNREAQLAALDGQIQKAAAEREEHGLRLRSKRQEQAGRLADAVTQELRALGFPHGAFAVDVRPADPSPSGMDVVEFGFAPNVGEPMRPLSAIASSGEISRVMLATKVVLAAHDRIPVMVFDEIDANVGGEMGRAIGQKLAEVAARRQVVCITHLPQVAVFGTTHLAVTKTVTGGRTVTSVQPLDEAARVEEVARMLGGRDSTSVALRHARELLRQR